MADKIRVLLNEEEVDRRIKEIADQINKDYEGKEVQAIFNQSPENFVLERDSVDLASHCKLEDGQEIILPDGFVVTVSE